MPAQTTQFTKVLAVFGLFGAAAGAANRATCGVPVAIGVPRPSGATSWVSASAGVSKFLREDPTPPPPPAHLNIVGRLLPLPMHGEGEKHFIFYDLAEKPQPLSVCVDGDLHNRGVDTMWLESSLPAVVFKIPW